MFGEIRLGNGKSAMFELPDGEWQYLQREAAAVRELDLRHSYNAADELVAALRLGVYMKRAASAGTPSGTKEKLLQVDCSTNPKEGQVGIGVIAKAQILKGAENYAVPV